LADDCPVFCNGLCMMLGELAPDVEVVGLAEDGEEAKRLIAERRPDVAVLDCQMPGQAGAEVAVWVREQGLPTRVLALSAHDDERHVYEMLQAGAAGYALKDGSLETVAKAIETVARGGVWYSQPVMCIVAAWAQCDRAKLLTERETQVLHLLAKGLLGATLSDRGLVKINDRIGEQQRGPGGPLGR
jgi:DNA-binding NarL/FixJ family response regulator